MTEETKTAKSSWTVCKEIHGFVKVHGEFEAKSYSDKPF